MSRKTPPASTTKGVAKLLRDGVKGEYSAGNSLYLSVNGTGVGSWIYRFQLDGKRRRIGLGSADLIDLAQARALAAKQKVLVTQGINPLQARKDEAVQTQQEMVTFDMVAADYIKAQRSGWKSAKHAQQWINTLATYASPFIGHLPPAEITTEHILKILQPIWNTKTETARRVRNRIELVLNAAKARKLRTGENVAAWRGHLELLLTKHDSKAKTNHAALDWRIIGEFWQAFKNDTDTSAQALMLTILTALRTSEVLGANWQEIDLDNAVWTIPAQRMKAGREHRVPLSQQALNLLNAIPRVQSGLLFEGQKIGKPVSAMAMLMKVRGLDERKHKDDGKGWRDENDRVITVHGFRSTFRDWAAENTRHENIVVEQALAHTIGDAVERAYRRGDLLERRRELMQTWANYVTAPATDNVIHLRKGA